MILDAILKISNDPSLYINYIYIFVYKINTWITVFQILPCYVLNLDFYKFSKNCKKARFVNEHFPNSTMYIINSFYLDCLFYISLKMQKQK